MFVFCLFMSYLLMPPNKDPKLSLHNPNFSNAPVASASLPPLWFLVAVVQLPIFLDFLDFCVLSFEMSHVHSLELTSNQIQGRHQKIKSLKGKDLSGDLPSCFVIFIVFQPGKQ